MNINYRCADCQHTERDKDDGVDNLPHQSDGGRLRSPAWFRQRVPDRIRQRVLERPDVFGRLADLDDKSLDRMIATLDSKGRKSSRKTK